MCIRDRPSRCSTNSVRAILDERFDHLDRILQSATGAVSGAILAQDRIKALRPLAGFARRSAGPVPVRDARGAGDDHQPPALAETIAALHQGPDGGRGDPNGLREVASTVGGPSTANDEHAGTLLDFGAGPLVDELRRSSSTSGPAPKSSRVPACSSFAVEGPPTVLATSRKPLGSPRPPSGP